MSFILMVSLIALRPIDIGKLGMTGQNYNNLPTNPVFFKHLLTIENLLKLCAKRNCPSKML